MNPITREEKLLDGQNIVPETRKEKFIKRIYDKTQPVPEPITREEWFLNKAAEGSGGDVTIEQLNVSQNGTYSEQGKAYSPVIVEVPEPVLTTKNITANGTYLASEDNADGYSSVEVSVAPPENSFILNTKKDDVVDISDAADFDIAGLKVDVTSSDEVLVGVGNGTEFVGNNMPYLFRETPHNVGNRVYEDAIVGASIPWNQLASLNVTDWAFTRMTAVVTDRTFALTPDTDSTSVIKYMRKTLAKGHKHLLMCSVQCSTQYVYYGIYTGDTSYIYRKGVTSSDTFVPVADILNPSDSTVNSFRFVLGTGATTADTANVKDIVLCDLTLMFGSTIADYAYSLEQATAGSGIAWLKSQGFFGKDYYAYNAGGIQSVKTSAKKVVGFNQWDEDYALGFWNANGIFTASTSGYMSNKTPIKVFPNTTYCITINHPSGTSFYLCYYDANGTFIERTMGSYRIADRVFTTPDNCHFICFSTFNSYGTTYNNDICINFHWDGERDGEYMAYEEHTYPLDSDLELRGIPMLVDGKIKYDGDLYASDGSVTRRYGIVDLGTLTWSYASSTFYAKLTPEPKNRPLGVIANAICSKYPIVAHSGMGDKQASIAYAFVIGINVKDSAYSDTATFKTAMSGVYLVYELATPTTESADPYTNPQLVDNWGTEEFVDTREVPVPVGHDSKYFDGEIYHTYIYDSNNERIAVTGTADLITGEVTGGNHCDTFVIKPTGDNVVVETGEVEVKYLAPLEAI